MTIVPVRTKVRGPKACATCHRVAVQHRIQSDQTLYMSTETWIIFTAKHKLRVVGFSSRGEKHANCQLVDCIEDSWHNYFANHSNKSMGGTR